MPSYSKKHNNTIMKKLLFVALFLGAIVAYSQSEGAANEVKLNAFNLIAFKWLDLSYERGLNSESSAGLTITTRLDNKNTRVYNVKYAVTPYYRYYFSEDNFEGIFGEAFGMINGGEKEVITKALDQEVTTYHKYGDFGFGLGGGYKFVSGKNFVAEAHAGVGRNLFGDEFAPKIVTRFGASLGYRF